MVRTTTDDATDAAVFDHDPDLRDDWHLAEDMGGDWDMYVTDDGKIQSEFVFTPGSGYVVKVYRVDTYDLFIDKAFDADNRDQAVFVMAAVMAKAVDSVK